MAIEAELVYRARDTAGRKDAAYIITMLHDAAPLYQVEYRWGSWERYRNATLQGKVDYTGTSYSLARSKVIEAMNKRTQRGYELQAHLSRFPNWLPAPLTAARQPVWQAPPDTQIIEPPPEPEPPPAGRVKHTRAGFLEL